MPVELLSPAGNLEKLKFAALFGADAVYFSYKNFGLRSNAENFTIDEIDEGLSFLHSINKKGYITLNIFAHNNDVDAIKQIIYRLSDLKPDAFIVSDPGLVYLIKKSGITIPLHLSTQANTTNFYAVKFWESLGISRIVLARELTLEEIAYICKNTNVEIEVFVHGAMCISYSGRCYLSHYLNNRDANKGDCTHPCRWKYYLVEETRKDELFEICEDESGSYILNSRDLCLIEHLGNLVAAGVHAFKIEGRVKSLFYTSIVTGVYKKVLNRIKVEGFERFKVDKKWLNMLDMVSNRGYTNGFINGYGGNEDSINRMSSRYNRKADFLGYFNNSEDGDSRYILYSRAKASTGEILNIYNPSLDEREILLDSVYDLKGNRIDSTKPNEAYIVKHNISIENYSLLARLENDL